MFTDECHFAFILFSIEWEGNLIEMMSFSEVLLLINYVVKITYLPGISDVNDLNKSAFLILQIILFYFLNKFHLFHLQSHINAKNMPIDIILEKFKKHVYINVFYGRLN